MAMIVWDFVQGCNGRGGVSLITLIDSNKEQRYAVHRLMHTFYILKSGFACLALPNHAN